MAKILWIEDEARSQLLEYLPPLMRAGHTIDIVESASDGYTSLQDNFYDVVIFDLLIKAGDNPAMEGDLPGLMLLRKVFHSPITLSPQRVVVFTAVQKKVIIDEIKKMGVKRIKVKERMEKTKLKHYVDEVLKGQDYESA